jgi:hypothetical protein
MAMSDKHTPVRIKDSLYQDIKEMSDSLGMSSKKLVEVLLTKSLEDLKRKDKISLTISRNEVAHKVTLK